MSKLSSIIVKEVKELVRDPKILIGVILMPILIFPVVGSAIRISQESVQRAVIGASFAIYTDDEGFVTEALLEYLYSNNTVVSIEAASIEEALRQFQETDSNALIYIPIGYNENLTLSMKGELRVYANLMEIGLLIASGVPTAPACSNNLLILLMLK